jgi:uncharacterized membrane protein YgcG
MIRFRTILSLVALLCVLGPALASPALAQDRSVTVERRDGVMTIARDGTVQVVETWKVHFYGGPFRFAFRSIPLNKVDDIDGWGVSEGGQAYREASGEEPGTFKLEKDGNERKITWYFPQTSDATRTFELRYTLHGALRIYPDGDQLFWKFIEDDREYTIEAAHVQVVLPADFQPSEIRSSSYRDARQEEEGGRTADARSVEFDGGPFPGGDEWEVRVWFPHGVVTAQQAGWQVEDDARQARMPTLNLVATIVSLLTALGGGLGLYLFWYRNGRDAPSHAIPAAVTAPPDDLPPGVIGTLVDERAEMRDITATLVDLARRGYLAITERKGEGWFAGTEYIFVRGDADLRELRPYERRIFNRLFGPSASECTLSSLQESFYREIPDVQKGLYSEVVQLGYFPESPNAMRNRHTLRAVLALIGTFVVGFFGLVLLFEDVPLIILLFGVLLGLCVAGIVLSRAMARKTTEGATAAARWLGFKRYLQEIERYTDLPNAREQFERYLPYAIAFGLERQWVDTFSRLGNTPAPAWYYPYGYPPHHHRYYGGYGHDDRSGAAGRGAGELLGQGGAAPTLDSMASSGFTSLNAMSTSFFSMLNSTASTMSSSPSSSGSGSGGGGGGGGGGGSSGFG